MLIIWSLYNTYHSQDKRVAYQQIFPTKDMLQNYSTLFKLLISDMHHRITYMHINFQQNRVSRSVNNGVTHIYNAKDNTKSNWCTAYYHCGLCPNKMTSEFQ